MTIASEPSNRPPWTVRTDPFTAEASGWSAAPMADPAPPSPPGSPPPNIGGHGWQEPGRRPPHALRRMLIALVVAVVVALTAVTLTVAAITRGSPNTAPASGGGAPATPSATGGQGTSPVGSAARTATIAAAVDPAVVDINTTLGLQHEAAAGTGIVISSSGRVLTNNHVIDGATSITATDIGNGKTYPATVVGYDRSGDLAVLQLRGASKLSTAALGNSSNVAVGSGIVAIGNAEGRGGTPATAAGTVTGLDQTITASDPNGANAEQLTGLIRINAAIQPGDSGGPLADATGHVVGIDTAGSISSPVRSTSAGTQGFAIPINQALTVASKINNGHSSATIHIGATAFIGVEVAPGTGFGSGQGGAPIAGVVPGSPAARAGLTAGDVIVSVGGTRISTPSTLTAVLASHHPGDRVTVGIINQFGQTQTVTLQLASGPPA